jgi:predicted GNAT family acetyltransferase
MALETRHAPDASRYELLDDGERVGLADYVLTGDVAVFPHTEIVPSRRGQGLGERLVRDALDAERAAGHKIVASCWFVADFIDAHPEYRALSA